MNIIINSPQIVLLKKEGYTELPKEGNKWVFLNDKEFNFSNHDKNNIEYTDQMFI